MSPRDIEVESDTFLGRGAGGMVTRAIHRPTGTLLAIKQVQLCDKAKCDQLLNDIRTLIEGCQCEQLVKLHAAYLHQASGRVHLALEYMDMGSLHDMMKLTRAPFPERHMSVIVYQVVSAIKYLHEHKLIHRDVKPGNILLNSDGCVKLSDFGISKTIDNTANICDTFVGTALYMSPERVFGKDYSFTSDIWSLGMVIFEMATGGFPFPSMASFPVLFDHLCNLPEPRLAVNSFSTDLCDIVTQCLQRDPSKRVSAIGLQSHPFVIAGGAEIGRIDFSAFLKHLISSK